jgi:hypothetical protein
MTTLGPDIHGCQEEKKKKTCITKISPSDTRYATKKSNNFTNDITNFTTLRFDLSAASIHSRQRDIDSQKTAGEKDRNDGH